MYQFIKKQLPSNKNYNLVFFENQYQILLFWEEISENIAFSTVIIYHKLQQNIIKQFKKPTEAMFEIELDAKEIQQALPQYQYIKRIGSGALATVHLIKRRDNQQQYALKKISCFGIGQYQKAGSVNQARILSSLEHKNLIKVHSCLFDNTQQIVYIFMQFAQSGDITSLIQQAKQKKKRIPESTIWKIMSDVSDGLQYLHKSQIIHRDIKPANIFRMGKNFKIGDMNVSKVLKNGIAASTKTGSPLYSAPQVWDSQNYDTKCDIWSLGTLIYQLCTLKVPFQSSNIMHLITKMKTERLKPLPIIYSSALDDVVRRMLEPDVRKRLTAEQIYKISSQKLKIQIENTEQNCIQNLMNTIVFPDTHQRWINLIPSFPPKVSIHHKKQSSSQIITNKSKSRQKKQNKSNLLSQNNSIIFRSTGKKQINIARNKSRSKLEKSEKLKIPPILPPIYKNSPAVEKKDEERNRSLERNERSSGSLVRNRKVLINQCVNSVKYIGNYQ